MSTAAPKTLFSANPTGAAIAIPRSRPVQDALTMTWRNLLNTRRTPQLLIAAAVQPVILVLLFRYIFGGAINVAGAPYVDYLMPGIFAATVVLGAITTGVGLAEDLHRGLVDRFRSLPMARSAVLAGRTFADLVRTVFIVTVICCIGGLVGWRVHHGAAGLVAAIVLVITFAYSLSWIFVIVGLISPDGETAQAASIPVTALLVFASSSFVPVNNAMPNWLQVFVNHQPVSVVVSEIRNLTLGNTGHASLIETLAWIAGIVAVCAPLAVVLYRRDR